MWRMFITQYKFLTFQNGRIKDQKARKWIYSYNLCEAILGYHYLINPSETVIHNLPREYDEVSTAITWAFVQP